MKQFTKSQTLIFYVIFIIAISLMFAWQRHLYPYINRDGVTYIQAAAAFLNHGFKAAVAIGDQAQMPFFPILVAMLSKLTHLSVLSAAYLLNNIFVCLSGILFVLIIKNLCQNTSSQKTILLLSAIIWLDWHAYTSWWPLVMRDHGAMCLLLLSAYCLLKFYNQPNFKRAVAWSLVLITGALFRFELGIFLVLLPVVLCVFGFSDGSKKQKIIYFLKLNIIPIICLFLGALLFAAKIISAEKLQGLRVAYIIDSAVNYFVIAHQYYLEKRVLFLQQLSSDSGSLAGYADLLFIAKLVLDGFKIIIDIIGPIGWLGLAAWFVVRKQKPVLNNKPVVIAYFGVAVLVPLAFYYQNLFLNSRYVLPLGVFALIGLAPSLIYLIETREKLGFTLKRFLCGILILVFIYNFVASVHRFGHVSNHQHTAGVWINKNLPNKTIFTNAKITMFYASQPPSYANGEVGHIGLVDQIAYFKQHSQWQQYDLLVLLGSKKEVKITHQYLFNLNQVGPVIKIFDAEHGHGAILITSVLNKKISKQSD